jgi:putative membrane protein
MRRRPPLSTIGHDPDYRFTFANERTFLAWIRTSLALVAAGVAVIQLLADEGDKVEAYVVGVPLICLGALMPLSSLRRWRANEEAMRLDQSLPPSNLLALLGWWVTLTALVAGVLFALAEI